MTFSFKGLPLSEEKPRHFCDGDHFGFKGLMFKVRIRQDDDHGAPWDENDGHGPVSDWTSRDKLPGERVLCRDRGIKRYYDFAEAMKLAKKDGWGLSDKDLAKLTEKLGREPTKGEITAAAVESDFDYLRGWANDDWHYVGIEVQEMRYTGRGNLVSTGNEESLWGIESSEDSYIVDTAFELADGIACSVLAEQEEVAYWAERDVVTR